MDVCRVCQSEDGVFLDLFGSKSQNVSYVADVKKCFSLEVKEGDGLPPKICVKCVGLISDCVPFVDNVHNLEKKSNTQASATKFKTSFNKKVPVTEKICHRCQYFLETIYELKQKACSALKHFYSNPTKLKNSLSEEEESGVQKNSLSKEESVGTVAQTSKRKFVMDRKYLKMEKEARIEVIDVSLLYDKDLFFKGSINVNEFMELLKSSSKKSVPSKGQRKELQELPPEENGSCDSTFVVSEEPQSPPATNEKKQDKGKKTLKTSSVEESKVTRGRRRSLESSESEINKTSKKLCVEQESEKLEQRCASPKPKVEKHNRTKKSKLVKAEDTSLTQEANKTSKTICVESEAENSGRVSPSSTPAVSKDEKATKIKSVSSDETSLTQEADSTVQRNRGRSRKSNIKYAEEDSPPTIKRKKYDENYSRPKGKKTVTFSSKEDGEASNGLQSVNGFGQPDHLKEVDKWLVGTPKSKFVPFICSVCCAGYVSTVKGKYHKLVDHDPHSKITLQLKRCDDAEEKERLKQMYPSIGNHESITVDEESSKQMHPCNGSHESVTTEEAIPKQVHPTISITVEEEAVSDDDLFAPDPLKNKGNSLNAKSTEESKDPFEDLLRGSSALPDDEKIEIAGDKSTKTHEEAQPSLSKEEGEKHKEEEERGKEEVEKHTDVKESAVELEEKKDDEHAAKIKEVEIQKVGDEKTSENKEDKESESFSGGKDDTENVQVVKKAQIEEEKDAFENLKDKKGDDDAPVERKDSDESGELFIHEKEEDEREKDSSSVEGGSGDQGVETRHCPADSTSEKAADDIPEKALVSVQVKAMETDSEDHVDQEENGRSSAADGSKTAEDVHEEVKVDAEEKEIETEIGDRDDKDGSGSSANDGSENATGNVPEEISVDAKEKEMETESRDPDDKEESRSFANDGSENATGNVPEEISVDAKEKEMETESRDQDDKEANSRSSSDNGSENAANDSSEKVIAVDEGISMNSYSAGELSPEKEVRQKSVSPSNFEKDQFHDETKTTSHQSSDPMPFQEASGAEGIIVGDGED